MWLPRAWILLGLLAATRCEEEGASTVFLEAAKSFFSNKDNINGLQGLARAFLESDGRNEASNMFEKSNLDSVGQIVSGIGSLFSGSENSGQGGIDFSMLGSVLDGVISSSRKDQGERSSRGAAETRQQDLGIDLEGIVNIGSMLMGRNGGNSELIMACCRCCCPILPGRATRSRARRREGTKSTITRPILGTCHRFWKICT